MNEKMKLMLFKDLTSLAQKYKDLDVDVLHFADIILRWIAHPLLLSFEQFPELKSLEDNERLFNACTEIIRNLEKDDS